LVGILFLNGIMFSLAKKVYQNDLTWAQTIWHSTRQKAQPTWSWVLGFLGGVVESSVWQLFRWIIVISEQCLKSSVYVCILKLTNY